MLTPATQYENQATKSTTTNSSFFGGNGSAPFFQAKLTVNSPGDAHEQEADAVADDVMLMSEGDAPIVQRMPLTPVGNVQRKCAACEEKEKEGVQRKETGGGDASGKSAPSIVSNVLSAGGGQPMGNITRQFMESRFGQDFSQVRIHTDARAAESASAIQARAYTSGRDVVFGNGEYQPTSEDGRLLLAHELVHVGQQDKLIKRTVNPCQPVVNHGHTATGRWADIQADARRRCGNFSGGRVTAPSLDNFAVNLTPCACWLLSPRSVMSMALSTQLRSYPLARRHLNHYLSGGGVDFIENTENFIRGDTGVRNLVSESIRTIGDHGCMFIEQSDYANQDYRNSFGALDKLEYEVNRSTGTIRVWFRDRYEWHPHGFGYSSMPGDGPRVTNCVHAAAVELKGTGAADFWMVGDNTFSLSVIIPATTPPPTSPVAPLPSSTPTATTTPSRTI